MIEAKDFWLRSLVREASVARLPLDRPRPDEVLARSSRLPFQIAGQTAVRAGKLSGGKPLLLHALLLSALNVVLFRLTEVRAAVVGTPATADHPEPNALPLISVLDPAQTFKSLLQQTRQSLLDATTHQIYPYSLLLRDLGLDRIADRCPLFDVALTIEGYHGDLPPLAYDISVQVACSPALLAGEIAYRGDLFDAPSIERLAVGIERVLDGALAKPEIPLGEVDLCMPSERTWLLRECSGIECVPPASAPLHKMFETQADQRPDAKAVVFRREATTFRELEGRANRLACWLQTKGVGPGIVVGLSAGVSVGRLVGFIGILKAGGIVLPLERDYPPDRRALMLADAGAQLVIDGNEADTVPASRVSAEVAAAAVAYIIYTSGSTGRPKGVVCTHGGLANLAAAQVRAFGVEPGSRVLQFSSFSFDASIAELAVGLSSGATLFLAEREQLFPGESLYGFLADNAITHVTLVPSVLSLLPVKPLPDLTTLTVAGEACPASLVHHWAPGRRFLNAYGPTEITVCASIQDCEPDGEPPAIGTPMAGIEAYVLDEHHQLKPPGVAGELYLGGRGLAQGYVNNPALTAARFIPNPFSNTPGSRLYRTGDRARFRPDGSLEFLGRIDSQVKVRGFRIELGEIEHVLAGHPRVAEAAVLCREDAPGAKRLVAYVAPRPGEHPDEDELREYLNTKLPAYLVPEAVVLMAELPKTAKLSVARDRLPAPKAATRQLPGGLLSARDTTELGLTQIWERVLGKNPVGVRENFFELGGHSFLAIKLLAEIRKSFQCDLPLAMLLERPTIEQLAVAMRARGGAVPWSPVVPIRPEGSRPRIFCVHPAGGTVLCYADLAAALGPDQPFFGLQEFGLAEGQVPLAEISQMAALYIRAMKEVQPDGPYLLAGWSFGGLAAYEMAQQLRLAGDAVALLVMFDTYAPSAIPDTVRNLDEVKRLMSLFGDDVDLSEDYLRSLDAKERVSYIVAKAKEADLLPTDFSIDQADRLITMFSTNADAVHDYQAKPYAGALTLFTAKEKTEAIAAVTRNDEPTHGWGSLAAHVTVLDSDGNHHTMLSRPRVAKIGAQLCALIGAL